MHVLIALAFLVQDPTAEELLKKAEEKVVKAKSLQAKTKLTASLGDETGELAVEAKFKGEKSRLTMEGQAGKRAMKMKLLADGDRRHFDSGREEAKTDEAPKGFHVGLRTMFVRGGSFMPLLAVSPMGQKQEGEVKDLLVASGVKYGKDEKVGDRAAKVLEYTLAMKGEKDDLSVVLWLDAETLLPLKRVIKKEKEGVPTQSFTEEYSDVKLDGEIDDKEFELPKAEEKK